MAVINIVLASKSPRRSEILSKFIKDFIIVNSNYKEEFNKDFDIITNSMSISRNKVKVLEEDYLDSIIIGADTIVFYNNKILHKPKNRNEAKEYLTLLSGRSHKVITSFCISYKKENLLICDYQETIVTFTNIDEKSIQYYLNSGEWQGKAGAYGIQGKASTFIKGINGDYWSVVGFPINKIYYNLMKYFNYNILES